ncbi:TraB/GumN family protein [Thiospirochaeta perfilievii]|uniref:TraB/GumN family protein n=1 Tax=Thiospirochaeta perfilievii TaxID=252967 RepID=A0A5C1Q6Q6_9SPIO|nr:TraB/GumN family protein [Thiospirochaeta perfilievii]QEN03675.1 TraB/GumN family protein [Thiospirochaeta perfilievii]
MNKKITKKLVLILLWIIVTASCTTTKKDVAQSVEKRALLWELTNGDTSIFIAGSIHIAPDEIYPLDDIYYESLGQSDHFVMEADVTYAGTDPDFQKFVMERALLPQKDDLANYIDKDNIEVLNEILSPFNMNFNQIRIFKPWMVTTILTEFLGQELGFYSGNGVDVHLQNVANQIELNPLYLESAESQIVMMDSNSLEYQKFELLSLLEDKNALKETFNGLMNAWISGDTEAIYKIMTSEGQDIPGSKEALDRLLFQRNKNWLEQVKNYLETGDNYFIVVGAGHLCGEGSLIDLLEKDGYNLNRL